MQTAVFTDVTQLRRNISYDGKMPGTKVFKRNKNNTGTTMNITNTIKSLLHQEFVKNFLKFYVKSILLRGI